MYHLFDMPNKSECHIPKTSPPSTGHRRGPQQAGTGVGGAHLGPLPDFSKRADMPSSPLNTCHMKDAVCQTGETKSRPSAFPE